MSDANSSPFPTPEWPPIQNVQSVDIVGRRNDGGVDLVIVASQPLDDGPETLAAIRGKVAYYLDVIDLPAFQEDLEYPPRDQTSIVLMCDHPIHPTAATVIAQCQATAQARGVRLVLRRKVSE